MNQRWDTTDPIYEVTKLQVFEKITKTNGVLAGIFIGVPIFFGIFYLFGLLLQKDTNEEQNTSSYYQESTTKEVSPLGVGAAGALLWVLYMVQNANKFKSHEEKTGTVEVAGQPYPSSPGSLSVPARSHPVEIEWQTPEGKKNISQKTDELGFLKIDFIKDLKIAKITSSKNTLDVSFEIKNDKGLLVVKNEALNYASWLVPYSIRIALGNAALYSNPDNSSAKVIGIERGKELFIQEEKGDWIKTSLGDKTGWLLKYAGDITFVEPEYSDVTSPPILETMAKFDDAGSFLKNQRLDGNEEARLLAIVSNKKGKGKAHQVRLLLSSSNSQIMLDKEILVGTINAGDEKEIEIPIRAPLKIANDTATIRVETKEKGGNDAAPFILPLAIRAIELPSLKVESYDVNDGQSGLADGDGDGIPESGETVELVAKIKNDGYGEAQKVRATLDVANTEIDLLKDEIVIPLINPSENVSIPFAFSIPRTFKDNSIKASIQLEEGRGACESKREIPLAIKRLYPVLGYSVQIHDGDSPQSYGNKDGKIQQGEIVELKIVPENKGDLEAEGVKISLESPISSITSLGRTSEDIGKIPKSSKANERSFVFNIQRATVPRTYEIPIIISQNDFQPYKGNIPIIVHPEPEVIGEKIKPTEQTPPPVVPKIEPIVVIGYPEDGHITDNQRIPVSGRATAAAADKKISEVRIRINGLPPKDERGVMIVPQTQAINWMNFNFDVALEIGKNIVEISAVDNENLVGTRQLVLTRAPMTSEIWLVCIGINSYLNEKIRTLNYAVNDAQEVAEYFKSSIDVASDHVFVLLDKEADLKNLKRILGTELKKRAKPNDMVIIFFAGHGWREEDPNNPDGDGYEKYLLPFDANPEDLFSTAVPMRELQTIFERILAQKLVFLADTCFSGAAKAGNIRTLSYPVLRAGEISDRFLDRISKGSGRVVLTAAAAYEGSREIEELSHGVFTYYLLEGLKGKADYDKDGLITVDEISQYVASKVSEATNENQHPVKKGETAGVFVLGRTKK